MILNAEHKVRLLELAFKMAELNKAPNTYAYHYRRILELMTTSAQKTDDPGAS